MTPKSVKVLYAAIVIAVAWITLAPLGTIGVRLLRESRHFSLLWEPSTLNALSVTLRATAASLLLSLAIAIPGSWFLCRTDLPFRARFRRILLFPYLIPPYLIAIAWISLAVPKIGFLNRFISEDFLNIYSFSGLVWVFASAYLPILLAPLCNAMDAMDPSLEEAARICGARPWKVFLKISLPCAAPVIAAASILFSLDIMSAFGIPALIGNPGRLYVLTTLVYSHAKMGGLQGTNQAFLISLWLLFFTVLFLLLNEWVRKKFGARLTSGKAPRQSVLPLGKWRAPVALAFGLLTFLLVVLPIGAVIINSFLRIAGDLRLSNLSLENYRYLFQMPELSRALGNSLYLSFITALVCVVLGFLIAYFKDRTGLPGKEWLNRLSTFPFAIPGTVIALALIVSFGTGWGNPDIALLGSSLLLLVAYILKYMALSVQSLTPAMSRIDPSLDEAARISGAGVWKMLRSILVPLMAPTLASIFLLTMLPVFSELTMSVLLVGPGIETVGTLLFQLQDYANPLAACSLAALIIAVLVVTLPLMRKLGRGRFS